MPELPEVETTRRCVEPVLRGARVTEVEVRRERMVRRQARPADFADRLAGRWIVDLRRHGKFLLTDLAGDTPTGRYTSGEAHAADASGGADFVWVTHLGMSGRISLAAPGDDEVPHTNVVVRTDRGVELRMVDPRTFGFVAVYAPDEYAASPLSRLGPDAYTGLPRSPDLARRLAGRTAPIKALLLDQGFLAGIGNIYADEILYRARIRPDRPGGSLTGDEVKALRAAVRPVLEAGLRWGGTSLDDLGYLLPDGRAGEYTARLRAYGREDEPCHRCGTPIRRTVLRARSSFWCPQCQM